MNKLSDYQVGDVLKIIFRTGKGDTTYKVEVENVNYNNNGLITIYGNELGSTAFDPTQVGLKTRYRHIISVERVSRNLVMPYRAPWAGMTHRDAMRYYGVG